MTKHSSRSLSTTPSMNFPIIFFFLPKKDRWIWRLGWNVKSITHICYIFSARPYRNIPSFIQRESQKILIRDMLIWSHLWKLNVCDHLNDHFLCFPTREKWTSFFTASGSCTSSRKHCPSVCQLTVDPHGKKYSCAISLLVRLSLMTRKCVFTQSWRKNVIIYHEFWI